MNTDDIVKMMNDAITKSVAKPNHRLGRVFIATMKDKRGEFQVYCRKAEIFDPATGETVEVINKHYGVSVQHLLDLTDESADGYELGKPESFTCTNPLVRNWAIDPKDHLF